MESSEVIRLRALESWYIMIELFCIYFNQGVYKPIYYDRIALSSEKLTNQSNQSGVTP